MLSVIFVTIFSLSARCYICALLKPIGWHNCTSICWKFPRWIISISSKETRKRKQKKGKRWYKHIQLKRIPYAIWWWQAFSGWILSIRDHFSPLTAYGFPFSSHNQRTLGSLFLPAITTHHILFELWIIISHWWEIFEISEA